MPKSSSASSKAPRRRQAAAEQAQRDLLRWILDHPAATCRGAAAALGMSFPNVCRLVAGFRADGLVVAREHRQTGKRGPWSQVLSMSPELGCVVGVDLEATQARGVLLDFANNVTEARRRPIPADAGPDEIVPAVAGVAAELTDLARRSKHGPCGVVGLALPGPVIDVEMGRIRTDLQFGEAVVEFVPAVRQACGIPVFSASNTYCFAAGHHRMRTPERGGIEMVILNRFGVGAAIMWDGRLFTGAAHNAGDLDKLRCGVTPPVRRYHEVCGGAALLRLERKHGGTRTLNDLVESPGDPLVREWLEEAVPAFADAIATAVVVYDPDRILVEGIFRRFLAGVRSRVVERVNHELSQVGRKAPPIEFFEGDDLMGARGAALLARDRVADEAVAQILRAPRRG